MSAHDVVPVAWMHQSTLDEFLNRETFADAWSVKVGLSMRGETVPLYSQATVDAMQERIDELTHARHALCDVDGLHDLIDETVLTAHGKLYEQIAARNAIFEHYRKHYAALLERIDELEAQLFIAQAEALPLFEVMHLEPVPDFPSIRP